MLRKFLGFAMVSGVGWLLDMAVFAGALQIGARPFLANLLGGLVGASFSFVVSGLKVFTSGKRQVRGTILWYLAYTALAIILMSGLIDAMTVIVAERTQWPPKPTAIATKIALTPLILLSNFFVARWMLDSTREPDS